METNNSTKRSLIKKKTAFASIILKGLGQIMLQENQVTGFLFLLGIFYGSFIMGFAALLATICGTATAFALKYDKSVIDKGLYGFSAALVGVALILFLKSVVLTWILIVTGSSLATIIQHFFIKRNIPVFTLPFVLVTWTIIVVARSIYADIISVQTPLILSTFNDLDFAFKGFGQVIFQDNLVAGLLFFIAVFVSSPISALYGFAGGILSAIIAFKFSVPINDISLGLFSYNAVLCAIVFAGSQIRDGVWVLFSVLLSLFISILMLKFKYMPLTFPFVLASCITLFFVNKPYLIIKKQIRHQ